MALVRFDSIQASQSIQTAQSFFGSGNTSNGTTITGGDIYLSGGNNITINMTGSTIGIIGLSAAPSPVNVSAGTTSNNLANIVFSNSNGVSFGLNGSTVTASVAGGAAITNVNISAGTTSNNLSNFVLSNSNNISFGLNGSTITASVSSSLSNINISAGSTSNNLSNFVFSNSNNISFGLNGSTVTADARNILSTYEPYPAVGLSTALVGVPTGTSAGISVYPFVIDEWVSAGVMNIPYSMSFVTLGTSSGQQTLGIAMGIYSRNVSTLSSIASTSFSIGITGNNSSYSINQVTVTNYTGYGATAQTNSAGVNITSGYTGMKMVEFPINTLLTPGNYWLAMIGTNSTSSVNVGISMSHLGAAMGTFGSGLAPIGSFSSAFSRGQDPSGRWYVGQGSWSSAGSVTNIPASMNFTSISAAALSHPLIKFWST